MPLPFLSVPQFPNIPDVLGVPPILRSLSFPPLPSLPSLMQFDGLDIGQFFKLSPQWGIFDQSGRSVIAVDSVVSVDFANEYRVSDYPLEEGAFESYNKVATPFDIKITVTRGGSSVNRQEFLDAIEALIKSLDLYTVVTPEKTYFNVNVIHVDYRRLARNGVSLITAELWVREIRVNATAEFTSTQTPSGAGKTVIGNVQTTPINVGQASSVISSGVTGIKSQITATVSSVKNQLTNSITQLAAPVPVVAKVMALVQ